MPSCTCKVQTAWYRARAVGTFGRRVTMQHINLCLLLLRYYLNGVDAFRLKLLLPLTQKRQDEIAAEELKQLSLSHGLHGTPSSSAPSADATKHGQPQNQQDQKEQHDLVRAGQTCQESQPNTAHDLLQRYDALRT